MPHTYKNMHYKANRQEEICFSVVLGDIIHAFAIHHKAIRAEFVPGNVVIFAAINELKSSLNAIIIIPLF